MPAPGKALLVGTQPEAGEAGADPEVLVAHADLAEVERQRRGWPFLRDRRIDAYGDLSRRYLDVPQDAERDGPRSASPMAPTFSPLCCLAIRT